MAIHYATSDPDIATIEPGRLGELPFLTLFCLFWNGVVFVIARASLREVLKRRKMGSEGRRVYGEIVRCTGEKDSDGDFVLAVRYRFRSPPAGAWAEDRDSHLRSDLKDAPLPPPDTPVCVLYLDDQRYMILREGKRCPETAWQ